MEPDELRERHVGILGLCACVNAFPYEVPEFLPEILVLLGDHLHDPQPIEVIYFIVKNCLVFNSNLVCNDFFFPCYIS